MSTDPNPTAAPGAQSSEPEHAHMLTVFSVSAGMVGVCLTAIGLIQVLEHHTPGFSTYADEIMVFDAIMFLGSCIFSYWALHHRLRKHYRRLRLWVDTMLMMGILLMALICGMMAYEIG